MDRAAWVLEHHKVRVKSARAWCEAAGVGPGTLGALKARRGHLTVPVAEKLADHAGVSADWLLTGRGRPEGAAVHFAGGVDPLPRRRIAVAHARKAGVPDQVLNRVVYAARYNTREHAAWKAVRWSEEIMSELVKSAVTKAAKPTAEPKKLGPGREPADPTGARPSRP